MKNNFLIISFLLMSVSLFAQNDNISTGSDVKLKKITINLTNNWSYQIQPNVPYDSIRLINKKGNIAVLIAYQKFDFKHVDFIEWEHSERFKMLNRAYSFPIYEKCNFKAVGLDSNLWERKGILSKFDMYKTENYSQENIVGCVYNYGESFQELGMILTIYCFVSGTDEEDMVSMIKSIKVLN